MSALTDFISKLSLRIRKPKVKSDIESTIKELREYTIPMAKEMATQYSVVPFSSEFYKVLESHVYDNMSFKRKSPNMWLNITDALLNVQENAILLEKQVNDYLQEDTLRDGISARSAQLLRMISVISFVSSYTLELCNYILAQEAVGLGDEDTTAPIQAKFMKDNIVRYCRSLADVSINPSQFETMFADIPDVFLNKQNESQVQSMFSAKALDPFKNMIGLSGWTGSPIYNIRMAWETYQAERYHANKDKKAMLELRLIHLQNRQNKENNPRVQKEIEGLEARIRKYDQKIRQVEESLS